MPYSMRPAPKMSLLMADTAADITTILRMVAADLMPNPSKICTNGLPWLPICVHGKIDISTNRVST
ncbi:hypothetical protein D3C77_667870 [compost metagenome]